MLAPHSHDAETSGVHQLINAFGPVFPEFRVLRNVIIPLQKDSPIASAEFDALVICSAGLFVFEIKGWRDSFVFRAKDTDETAKWFVRPNGAEETHTVRDPSAQGARKMVYLRSLMPERMRVHYYVFLPCNGVEIDPAMPAGIVTQADLPYLVRSIRSSSRSNRSPYTNLDAGAVDIAAQMILSLQGDLDLEGHIRNCELYAQVKNHSLADVAVAP